MERSRVTEAMSAMESPEVDSGNDVRPAALGSGLVVELDRQYVRAVYLGSVEGHGRLIASATSRSTALPPIDDASVAVRKVVRDIEEQLGLELYGGEGIETPSRDDVGVDYVAVTGQPVAPTRLAIVPLGESQVSRALVEAAGRSIAIVELVGPEVRTGDGVISGALFEQHLRAFRPDTVVLVEGSNAIVEWSTVIGTLAGLAAEGAAGQIIIIASEHYQHQAAQMFGEDADLRGIDPAEFPAAEIAAALEAELHALYEARLDPRSTVATHGELRYVSQVRASDLVTRFLARRRQQSVVTVASGDGTTLHWASGSSSEARARPDIDVFTHVRGALALDPDQITRWLPFVLANEDLAHWVLNRALRPFSLAEAPRDVAIESAIITAPLRDLWASFQASRDAQVDVIVAGRPWAQWPDPTLAVFSLLNIFQPNPAGGLVEIVLDVDGIVPAAGAIGEQNPALAADAVENDLMVPTASVIVVRGSGSDGDLAVRGQLRLAHDEPLRFSVPFGALHHIPLPPGKEATLSLTAEPRFSIGDHRSGEEIVFGRATPLRGSDVGIIIDARGRPLQLPGDTASRASRVASWLEDLGTRI